MRLLRKFNLIKKAGGKCTICGYKKNLAGLAFHHIDEKGTRLSGSHLIQMTVDGAEQELNRCVLVCHNCHSEIHNPDLKMTTIASMCKLINSHEMTQIAAFNKFFNK